MPHVKGLYTFVDFSFSTLDWLLYSTWNTCTFLSNRKYTEATNTPWKEYRKCNVNDHTANDCHEPRRGFGHTWCNMFVTPRRGKRKNKDFKDFLKGNRIHVPFILIIGNWCNYNNMKYTITYLLTLSALCL